MRLACAVTRSSSACCLAGRFLVAADLLVPGRIAAAGAAIDGRELPFQPRAHRIGLARPAAAEAPRRGASAQGHLRPTGRRRDRQQASAEQQTPSEAIGRAEQVRVCQAYPAIENDAARAAEGQSAAAKAACNSRFSGQRHVVSGAPVWQARDTAPIAADGRPIQRWQVIATYSPQRGAGAFSGGACGTAPVISSGSTRR